jgi:DNA-binding GntR family transcriptional regulator
MGRVVVKGKALPKRSEASPKRLSRRVPFAHQVADNVRDMIVRGEMASGSRIIERSLCEQLHVSRTPLREALKILQLEGLVELSQNKGARIISFTHAEARDLFEVIASLESLAAEIAVTRIENSALAEIEEMHERMCGHFKREEKDPYFALNSDIHERVVTTSANPVLISTRSGLMVRARRGQYIALVDPGRWAESVEEHEELMRAFRTRDPERARRIWRQHLLHTGDAVCNVLRGMVAAPVK